MLHQSVIFEGIERGNKCQKAPFLRQKRAKKGHLRAFKHILKSDNSFNINHLAWKNAIPPPPSLHTTETVGLELRTSEVSTREFERDKG
jgi:hypothetical protein